MLGKLISTLTKTVTLPLDAANAGLDLLSGGDGSKKSRTGDDTPLALLEKLRDRVAEAAEEIDDD